MKHIFIDTNIIVDLLAKREPFYIDAVAIFQLAEKKKINLYTSSHSIATIHYLLKKHIEEIKLREVLLNLIDFVEIITIDKSIIIKSLKSKHKDFEDAIQIYCAYSVSDISNIITRNIIDFKESKIKALTPREFISQIDNK